MPLTAPNLDDRTFQNIVDEAVTLIPRYAPEWTNHNHSDPGIALVQLFAWMTEMMLYRLNQVPERNYVKFLQLLGIELNPARPAATSLTFTLARDDIVEAIVPKSTQVAASDDEGPIIFETDEALNVLSAALTAVQVFDGFGHSVETTTNQATGQSYYPFGVYAREESAWLLGFDSDLEFTQEQFSLAVYLEETATDSVVCQPSATLPLPAHVVWEYWDGDAWQALSLDKDETQAFALSGYIYLRGPGSKIVKDTIGDIEETLYWIRCRLEKSFYETAPKIDTVLINTVRATQAITVEDEVLGGSSGRPGQTFTLANAPIVPFAKTETVKGADDQTVTITDLRLEVDEGSGFAVWQQVDDFYASQPNAPHYTLNRTTGAIAFGDGINGRIPVANPANPNANIVARLYRYGGGTRGNVGAGAVADIQEFVPFIDTVTNPFAATGGSDEESVPAAQKRAPQEIKSRGRAVTAEDFEYFAMQTPGVRVRRAKALALAHPQFPGTPIPGTVTVVVVPDSDSNKPMPGQRTLEAVCHCLNEHRLITTEVYVVPPTYHKVQVKVKLIAQRSADLAQVKRTVEENLVTFFHPLRGGEDGLGWEFGGTIYYSEVYRTILETEGLARIDNNQLTIWLDDEPQPLCRDVTIPEGTLLYSAAHEISVAY